MDHLLETNKESENLCKQEIQIRSIKKFSTRYGLWQVQRIKKRTQSDKVLKQKVFEMAANPKYDGYQRGLASMVYKFFDKKSKGAGIKNEIKQNQQLANELHEPIIRKFKKRKLYSLYIYIYIYIQHVHLN